MSIAKKSSVQIVQPTSARVSKLVLGTILAIGVTAVAMASASTQLVTDEEARVSQMAGAPAPRAVARTDPDAPKIEVRAPQLDGVIRSPAKVDLRFSVNDPARVKMDSLRVLYGAFRIDITSRFLKLAKLQPEGITVEEVNLPQGSHRIWVEIQDTLGRQGTQMLSVTVQ